jgi:hypothetical protein
VQVAVQPLSQTRVRKDADGEEEHQQRPAAGQSEAAIERGNLKNMSNKRLIIVGVVAGGASAAARARRLREDCEIIMFGHFESDVTATHRIAPGKPPNRPVRQNDMTLKL